MSNEDSDLSEAEIEALVEQARKPALLLNKTKFPDDLGEPGCWLGGEPTLPPEIDWPHQEVEGLASPLYFIAQINLATVPEAVGFPEVPESGTLFFFFDPTFWTFDAKVIYVEEDVSMYPPRHMPDLPEPEQFKDNHNIGCLAEALPPFKKWNFDWLDYETFCYAKHNNRSAQAAISKKQQEMFWAGGEEAKDRWRSGEANSAMSVPQHFLFGCQQTSLPPQSMPKLLLTIREDEDIGLQSGAHHLFWIQEQDLTARNFDKAFLTKE